MVRVQNHLGKKVQVEIKEKQYSKRNDSKAKVNEQKKYPDKGKRLMRITESFQDQSSIARILSNAALIPEIRLRISTRFYRCG